MTDEYDHDLPDDLADRIRRYAEHHPDATAAGVIGAVEDLAPPDRDAIRAFLDGEAPAEPVTESNENDGAEGAGNISAAKSRRANTPEGAGTTNASADGDDSDRPDNTCNRPGCSTPGEHDPLEAGSPDANPWLDAVVSPDESGIFPEVLDGRAKWMGAVGKQAYAPWADRDHPEAEADEDARWKWGLEANHAVGDTVEEWVGMDPRLDARAFIQLEADPFAFVDGDDVRCPDTGAVHPAFRALLEHLGTTYADVSTSGSGIHAHYRGDLPLDGHGQAVFEIDTEPFGANDDPPTVEIYANTHLAITSGDHIPGGPLEVAEWNADALRAVLEAAGFDDEPEIEHDTDRDRPDLEAHDPEATGADDTADDVRDVLKAVDRLRPHDLPLQTRQVDTDATGWEKWDPSSYRTSSGNDSLHRPPSEPVFHDHKHGKAFGVLSLFAAEERIISKPWDRLAGAEWWEAVEAARDAGAPIPEFDHRPPREGGEPVAVLSNTPVDRAEANGWHWRHASRRAFAEGAEPMQAARDRTAEVLVEAIQRHDHALVEALPTLGKSYGAVKAAADTGEPVAILTTRGRKEQYDQLAEWCDEHGLTHRILPAFGHDCNTANGEHGEEWAERVRGWYDSGATPKQIHKYAEDVLDRPLPCQADGRTCEYAAKWAALDSAPDAEEPVDVLIGHYTHAHKRKVTAGRAVMFDEFPDGALETTLAGEHELAGAVSQYLDRTPQLPFDDYAELLEHRHDDGRRAEALAFLLEDLDPDALEAFDGHAGHAYAPLAVFTLLAGEDLGNGRELATFPESDRKGVFDREANRIHILTPPDLEPARSVLALDGTPTKRLWELVLGDRLTHRRVLDDDERREYVEDVLGLQLVRTTEHVKPYASGEYVNTDADMALLERIQAEHGEAPGVITSSAALTEYADADALDYDPDDGTVTSGPAARAKWYGNVLGSNEFKHKRVGAVLGSNHYGDGYIKKWGAYAGDAVERGDGRGAELSYSGLGDDVLQHMREHDTLQAAMRFGRDGNGAVVYVHTDTLPEWVPVAGEGRVVHTWSDGMKDVVRALDDLGEATTAAVVEHDAVALSRQQVFEHLEALRERDVLDRRQDTDDARRVVWRDDGLHRIGEHGEAELEPVELEDLTAGEVRQLARSSIYTWELTNRGAEDADTDPPTTDATTPPPTGRVIDGDPPLRPGD